MSFFDFNCKKLGIIITTTYGYNGIFISQCIECYLRLLPEV